MIKDEMNIDIKGSYEKTLLTKNQIKNYCNDILYKDSSFDLLLKLKTHLLENFPHIETITVNRDVRGRVNIDIKEQEVLARIITSTGSYYITKKLNIITTSANFSIPTIFIRGKGKENIITDIELRKKIGQLLLELYEKKELYNEISTIWLNEKENVKLYTQFYDFYILFGNLENIQKKLNKMVVLFKKIVERIHENTYKEFDVRLSDNIIIGKKI